MEDLLAHHGHTGIDWVTLSRTLFQGLRDEESERFIELMDFVRISALNLFLAMGATAYSWGKDSAALEEIQVQFAAGNREVGLDLARNYAEESRGLEPEPRRIALKSLADVMEKHAMPDHADGYLSEAVKDSQERLQAWNSWGSQALERGDFVTARSRFQQVHDQMQKKLGSDDWQVGFSKVNLAAIHQQVADFPGAMRLYKEAVPLIEKTPKKYLTNNVVTQMARTWSNFGLCHLRLGDFQASEHALHKSRDLAERSSTSDAYIQSVMHLGLLYRRMGDHQKALEWYALCLRQEPRLTAADRVRVLYNQAVLFIDLDRLDEAEKNYGQALAFLDTLADQSSSLRITVLRGLASIDFRRGRYATSHQRYTQALRLCQDRETDYERTQIVDQLGYVELYQARYESAAQRFEDSLRLRRQMSGPDHPALAKSLEGLALSWHHHQEPERAEAALTELIALNQRLLKAILSFTSEDQRLAFLRTHPFGLNAAGTMGRGDKALEIQCLTKGVILDSILRERRLAKYSGEDETFLTELKLARAEAFQLGIEGHPRAVAAREKVAKVEKRLAQALPVLPSRPAAVPIPADGYLIDFFRYYHHSGADEWEARYGAVIAARELPNRVVSLGSSAVIDREVQRFRRALKVGDASMLENRLVSLYEHLIGRLDLKPTEDATIILCPDGDLNVVPFAALLNPDTKRFLIEEVLLQQISSPRDLAPAKRSGRSPMPTAYFFGNPTFARDPDSPSPFTPLPHTESEVQRASALLNSHSWKTRLKLRESATEAALRQIASPRVLHLSTHGFFLSSNWKPLPEPARRLNQEAQRDNIHPMDRCGVALADAGATVKAWQHGRLSPLEDDGVLLSNEAAELNLSQTDLVVLSACSTGLGEVISGEGVFGLRRGFAQAGARHLLVTLWPVNDRETVTFMESFYKRYGQSNAAPAAFQETQKEWLLNRRSRNGLVDAVTHAAPFVLTRHRG